MGGDGGSGSDGGSGGGGGGSSGGHGRYVEHVFTFLPCVVSLFGEEGRKNVYAPKVSLR
jgi:hypothetical protein